MALAPARGGKMLLKLHQGEAGSRRVAPLVAPIDARPLPGLLAALASEDAEADRHGVLHGELMKSGGRFARHDVVMGGLAADDAAERDAAAMAPCPADKAVGEREAERERDLERARHGDPLIGDALRVEFLDRAAGELVGDILVEARLDDEDRAWTVATHD